MPLRLLSLILVSILVHLNIETTHLMKNVNALSVEEEDPVKAVSNHDVTSTERSNQKQVHRLLRHSSSIDDSDGYNDVENETIITSSNINRTRLVGLTPFEQQEVVTLNQVLERFPQAFQARLVDVSSAKDVPTTPYLYMGFAKMGTTSIGSFWKCAGYFQGYTGTCHYQLKRGHYHHWDEPNTNTDDEQQASRHHGPYSIESCFRHSAEHNSPLLQSCGYPDHCMGYTQIESANFGRIPQLDHLQTLLEEEPNATLFLPFRHFPKWIKSQMNWKLIHGDDLMMERDYKSPYFGFDAFDRMFPAEDYMNDMNQRQQDNQRHFLEDCIWNKSGIHSQETLQVFQQLEALRGHGQPARLALFWVYYVTYLRSFASAHHVNLIEFDLDDPQSGETMLDLFQIPQGDIMRDRCWNHINATPEIEVDNGTGKYERHEMKHS